MAAVESATFAIVIRWPSFVLTPSSEPVRKRILASLSYTLFENDELYDDVLLSVRAVSQVEVHSRRNAYQAVTESLLAING